jgi:hypothetical protein
VGLDGAYLPAVVAAQRGVWKFLEIHGIGPTNNTAERALRQSVIQHKNTHGDQSSNCALWRSRLLTVTTTLRNSGGISSSSWGKPGLSMIAVA